MQIEKQMRSFTGAEHDQERHIRPSMTERNNLGVDISKTIGKKNQKNAGKSSKIR